MEWMILPLKRYAEFSGRSRRMEFWMFGIMMATGGFMERMAAVDPENPLSVYGAMFGGVGLILAVWALAVFIPSIAVTVRRLHDRDMSGWWYLGVFIGSLIPILNIVVSIGFLVLMLLPGTPGPNRFGPDPKNPTGADVFS